jgi:hypothetical protein
MSEVVLCDGVVKITIQPNHRGAVLSITQEDELRFPLTRSNLAAILDGETIQFSHKGVFCKLSRSSDDIRIVFAWRGAHDSAICPAADVEHLFRNLETSN